MSNYSKGRAKEYACMRLLEKENYTCYRSAGSHSAIDIIAALKTDYKNCDSKPLLRFIQCKSGSSPIKSDLIKISKLKIPHIISRELWQFLPRKKPVVHLVEPA